MCDFGTFFFPTRYPFHGTLGPATGKALTWLMLCLLWVKPLTFQLVDNHSSRKHFLAINNVAIGGRMICLSTAFDKNPQSDPYCNVQSLLIHVRRVHLLIVVGNGNPGHRSSVTAQEQKRDVTRSGHQVDQHRHTDSAQSWQIQLLHQQPPKKDTQTGTGDGCHTWRGGETTWVSTGFTGNFVG